MFYSDKNKGSQHKDAKMSVLQQHIHFLIHSVQADWINEVMPKYVIDSHITASLDNAFILKFATGSLCVHHSGLDSWRQLLEADLSLHIQLCGYRTDITASGFLLFTLLFWFHFFPHHIHGLNQTFTSCVRMKKSKVELKMKSGLFY